MTYLGKDAWQKSTLKVSDVDVPELGGKVRIRELPAEYSADVASNIKVVTEGREQVARVDTATMERLQFAYGVINDNNEPMFSEQEAGALAKIHGRAYKTVIAAIDNLSGVDKEAIEKAEQRFPNGGATEGGPHVGVAASAGDS